MRVSQLADSEVTLVNLYKTILLINSQLALRYSYQYINIGNILGRDYCFTVLILCYMTQQFLLSVNIPKYVLFDKKFRKQHETHDKYYHEHLPSIKFIDFVLNLLNIQIFSSICSPQKILINPILGIQH